MARLQNPVRDDRCHAASRAIIVLQRIASDLCQRQDVAAFGGYQFANKAVPLGQEGRLRVHHSGQEAERVAKSEVALHHKSMP